MLADAALGLCSNILAVRGEVAQVPVPDTKPPDGAALFERQCATCHAANSSDPPRQGPTLFSIVGRKAGKADGFRYSSNFVSADFVWDDNELDARLTNPPAIVSYLKELH